MAIDFPASPSLNDTFSSGGVTYTWDGTVWVASGSAAFLVAGEGIDALGDVTVTAAATGEVLRYNGSTWVDTTLSYNDLSDQPTIPPTAPVDSVNTQTGAVVLDTDDISEGTTNLYSQWDDATGGINYAGGNVGIGKDNPQVALDLEGQTSTSFTQGFNVRLTDNRTAAQGVGAGISFRGKWDTASPTATADFAVITGIKENSTDGNYAGALVFGTRVTGTGAVNTEKMRIDSSGNVGIGTTNPGAKLDVNGSLSKNSGSFKIDHPLPALTETHHLVHSFVEAPDASNLYAGMVDLVDGTATVNIDTAHRMTEGTFEALNTLQSWSSSNESGYAPVKCSISGNILTIECQDPTSTDTVYYEVRGIRKDQHMLDTEWTDSSGTVITEPLKPASL